MLARQCARSPYTSARALIPEQTFLEKVKTLFTDTPGLDPERIAPTIGQNSASRPSLCHDE